MIQAVVTSLRYDDCLYYLNSGIGNNIILNNLTLTGTPVTTASNRIIYVSTPQNFSFVNSKVVDFYWP